MTPEKIKAAVCEEYGISQDQLLGRSRLRKYVEPRQIAYALCWKYRGRFGSLGTVGAEFGRDHTTIIHGLRRFNDRLVFTHQDTIQAIEEKLGADA